VYFGVGGKVPETLESYRYNFDDNFHMTTHFLGKEPLTMAVAAESLAAIRVAADQLSPFSMKIKEFATYGPPEAQARVAVFEAPRYIAVWREAIAIILGELGATVSRTWPWSAHMTYAYGFDLDVVSVVEQQLLEAKATINIVSLEMYDGTGKLVVPLTKS